MNLSDYRKSAELSQGDFAKQLTEAGSKASQGLISQWESGAVKVPPDRWGVIEKITGGQVTRHDLRPDIFGPAPTQEGRDAA